MTKLKAYMGFSRSGGSQEGAVLIFAHTAKEAKKVGYGHLVWCEEFTDFAVRLLRNEGFDEADQEKLTAGIPHVNDNPRCCEGCMLWGVDIQENGYCIDCDEEQADE